MGELGENKLWANSGDSHLIWVRLSWSDYAARGMTSSA